MLKMTSSGEWYICAAGDTFDSIAREMYGDENYAAELLCFNPALSDKYELEAGDYVELPYLYIPEETDDESDTAQTVTTAPWK